MAAAVTEPLSPTELEGRWNSFFDDAALKKRIAQAVQKYPEVRSLEVEFHEIDAKDSTLADNLLQYPEPALLAGEKVLGEALPQAMAASGPIRLRIAGLPPSSRVIIHLLRETHLNRFLSVEGIVRRMTEVRPQMKEAVFECVACGGRTSVPQDEMSQTIKEATRCTSCEKPLGKTRFVLLPEVSKYIDSQKLDVQENPETLKGGSHPEGVTVILTEDLTGHLIPGDRLKVSGTLRSLPKLMGNKAGGKNAVFDIALFANHVEKEALEYAELEITDEDKTAIEDLRGVEGVFDRFVDSLAPSIQGMRVEKEAIALQLFGGVPKVQPDGIHIRGDIHILLIGDPGTGKSQLLRYVAEKIAPRGIYTSGKGATAAGLTAAAVKDDFGGGRWTLEAGAMVLADRGMLMVDELDKMTTNDRSSMHEALEQQSYHSSTEIMAFNGEKRQIGTLVDSLFSSHPEMVIQGKDCEILPLDGFDPIQVLTTDLGELYGVRVDRVSRHAAPPEFLRLTYGNGRIITVTPEHPVFVWRGGEFEPIPARSVKPGDLAPGVRWYPRGLNEAVLRAPAPSIGRKNLSFPSKIDERLARLLGYVVSEGHIYFAQRNRMAEVMVANTDPTIIEDVRSIFSELFSMEPYIQVQDPASRARARLKLYQVRAIGMGIFEYFRENFPELLKHANEKRVPGTIFHADEECRIQFVLGAFRGDGFYDSERFGLTTSSPGLARDYADLLLSLGIYSYITRSEYEHGDELKKGIAHKVVVSGSQSQRRFYDLVARDDPRAAKILEFVKRSESAPKDEDRLPTHFILRIRKLLQQFRMDDGYFYISSNSGGSSHRIKIQAYVSKLAEHVEHLSGLNTEKLTPRDFRKAFGISLESIAERTEHSVAWVCLHDTSMSSPQSRSIRDSISTLASEKLAHARREIGEIDRWLKSPVRFVRIRKVETVPNAGEEWVYDVTVEPTHAFISDGLMLHNTVSVSKAGITASLKARCPVLAAANPKFGRFDENHERFEDIDLPPTLLSRFDVIFAIQDKASPEKDRSLAGAILAKHAEAEHAEAARSRGSSGKDQEAPPGRSQLFPPDFMRKYIAYARKNVFPVMDDSANKALLDFFVNMRKPAEGGKKPVPITLRQVEGLVRLTEASAKARLSPVATKGDAERAIRIVESFLKSVATTEGGVDIDTITVGVTSFMRGTINTLRGIMADLQQRNPKGFTVVDLVDEARKQNITEERVMKALENLKRLAEVYEPRTGTLLLMK